MIENRYSEIRKNEAAKEFFLSPYYFSESAFEFSVEVSAGSSTVVVEISSVACRSSAGVGAVMSAGSGSMFCRRQSEA